MCFFFLFWWLKKLVKKNSIHLCVIFLIYYKWVKCLPAAFDVLNITIIYYNKKIQFIRNWYESLHEHFENLHENTNCLNNNALCDKMGLSHQIVLINEVLLNLNNFSFAVLLNIFNIKVNKASIQVQIMDND